MPEETQQHMRIALELVGVNQTSEPSSNGVALRKFVSSPNTLRLEVEVATVMGAEQANHVAALLLDELDRLQVPAAFYKVTMMGLSFSNEGASALASFLAGYASTVVVVALIDVLRRPSNRGGADYDQALGQVVRLASAFEEASLQVLDLSRNVLSGASIWKPFRGQKLQQLLLDRVEIEDGSCWQALSSTLEWGYLEDLHVVLENSTGPGASSASAKTQLVAANHIVSSCTKLSSLRWIILNKSRPTVSVCTLPWRGVREMARTMFQRNVRGGSLRHLVLEGSCADMDGYSLKNGLAAEEDYMSSEDLVDMHSLLTDLPRLRTLKLRHLGLTDIESLVASLRNSRPPLEILDLSHNNISDPRRLQDLIKVNKTVKDLHTIALSFNQIDNEGGREIIEAFAGHPKTSTRGTFDLRLNNNAGLDMNRVLFAMAASKQALANELSDIRGQMSSDDIEPSPRPPPPQRSMSGELSVAPPDHDIAALQEENRKLREDNEALIKAFSVMGATQQVDEHKRMLDRLARLEDMMLLGAVLKGSDPRGDDSQRRKADRRSSNGPATGRRRILVGDLPFSLDRFRASSVRSIGSAGGGNSGRSYRSQASTADLTDESPSHPPISPAPSHALVSQPRSPGKVTSTASCSSSGSRPTTPTNPTPSERWEAQLRRGRQESSRGLNRRSSDRILKTDRGKRVSRTGADVGGLESGTEHTF